MTNKFKEASCGATLGQSATEDLKVYFYKLSYPKKNNKVKGVVSVYSLAYGAVSLSQVGSKDVDTRSYVGDYSTAMAILNENGCNPKDTTLILIP